MMDTTFHLPQGVILFEEEGVAYEFREHLEDPLHGPQLFLARRRTAQGDGGFVVLKCVGQPRPGSHARMKRLRTRLEEEVRLARYLDHPGIVRVHGLHKAEGVWYVILERPEANTVGELLTLATEQERYFSPGLVLHVGTRVARVLEHAHTREDERGQPLDIVHRGINPDNVLMDWEGRVKVAEFAMALSALPGRVTSTVRGPRGDAYYASPEMLLGYRVDARSDLFMLGLTLLELATGTHLFDAPDGVPEHVRATLTRRQRERVRRALRRAEALGCTYHIEDILWRAATFTAEEVAELTAPLPKPLCTLLRKLLRRPRAERPQTAEVLQELEEAGVAFGEREAAEELKSLVAAGHEERVELSCPPPHGSFRRPLLLS